LSEEIFKHDAAVMMVVFSTINKTAKMDLALPRQSGAIRSASKTNYAGSKTTSPPRSARQTAVAAWSDVAEWQPTPRSPLSARDDSGAIRQSDYAGR
jgi:hypothetical protein